MPAKRSHSNASTSATAPAAGTSSHAVIQFYRPENAYGFFSNFSHHGLLVDGKHWPTAEHYFQAQKFVTSPKWVEDVRRAATPSIAKKMGGPRYGGPFRPDWDDVRDAVMRVALYAKFTQHSELQTKLIATGDAKLVEHTRNDRYWGDGGDGSGKNRLGILLMELRAHLRSPTTRPFFDSEATTPTSEAPEPSVLAAAAAAAMSGPSDSSSASGAAPSSSASDQASVHSGSEDDGTRSQEDNNDDPPLMSVPGAAPSAAAPPIFTPVSIAAVADARHPATERKTKLRKQREVFRDADGSSKLEITSSTSVRVLGDEQITIDKRALPTQAKIVAHRHQFQRRWQAEEEDLAVEDEDDDGDDDAAGRPSAGVSTLLNFLTNKPWTCDVCTLQNDGLSSRCAICGASRAE